MVNIQGNQKKLELYNKQGVLVYEFRTFRDGSSSECTFDENGRALTLKSSSGNWSKYTRDEKGNELTFENSYGRWSKYTRNNEGKELTFENSNGEKRGLDTLEFTMEELVAKLGDFKLIK